MSAYDSAALECAVTDDSTEIDKRDVRALTEYMTTLPLGGDMYSVTTESGSEYRVDARGGRCTCPDHQYRDVRCKHVRRVAFATGERPIPSWVNMDAVDELCGEHVDGTCIVATDGGDGTVPSVSSSSQRDDDEGVVFDTDTHGGRPDDCDCGDWNEGMELPCWPCYRDGFETPAEGDD